MNRVEKIMNQPSLFIRVRQFVVAFLLLATIAVGVDSSYAQQGKATAGRSQFIPSSPSRRRWSASLMSTV